MEKIMLVSNIVFWVILSYYFLTSILGIRYRLQTRARKRLAHYPSLDVFIPCHNEEVVIKDTLTAMSKLEYKGDLNIYVLNDQSTDQTGDIIEEFAAVFKHIHHVLVPEDTLPKGKSRVLNHALSISSGEYFIVYDADNQPESDAAERLMEITCRTKNAAGAVGTVRTINAEHNFLTRFIALEFKMFQLTMQSGRYALHQVGSLPGTNMLLKRDVIDEMGGYDPYALAEDAELTIRIASKNYIIAVDPHAQTWEQEPQDVKSLIKQRTRWLQGNLYVMAKFFRTPSWWRGKAIVHLFYYFFTYVVFLLLLVISNAVFICGVLGYLSFDSAIPYTFIWFLTYFLYTTQLIYALWYDDAFTGRNIIAAFVMYFTYAQLFLIIFIRSLFMLMRDKKKGTVYWDKTKRNKV